MGCCPDRLVTRSVSIIFLPPFFFLLFIFFLPISSILFLIGGRLIPALQILFSQRFICLCNLLMLRSTESLRSEDLPRITSFMVFVSATRCCVSMLITLLTREQKASLACFTLVARPWLLDPELGSGFSNLITCSS